MGELIAQVEGDVVREYLGYKLIKEDNISCGNCSHQLLTVVKVNNAPIKNYYIVNCPYCGDKSFKYLIEGKTYIGPADGLTLADVKTDYPLDSNGGPIKDVFINYVEVKCQT